MGDSKALMKEAEDALKTGWLKWEPDHIAAGSLFEQAAKVFRGKGDGESALGAYLKAAKSHLSKGGSGYEAAAAAYQAAGQAYPQRASEMYTKSIELYNANGSVEEALQVMGKAAESFERSGDMETALNLYVKAVDLVNIDEFTKSTLVQQFWTLMNTAFRKLIAGRRLAEASKCANKMLTIQKLRNEKSPKMVLQVIIVFLARGDIAAARQLLSVNLEDASFFRSGEGEAAQLLLEAWEKLDADAIMRVVEGPTIKYLDTQVVYLARELNPANKAAAAARQTGGESASERSQPAAASKAAVFAPSSASKTSAASNKNVSTPNPATTVPVSVPRPAPAQVPQLAVAQPQPPVMVDEDADLPDIR
jgi:tetratricopeptide (TPR) repeat protein